MLGKSLIQAASGAGGAAGGPGIEELFQTWLYTGNGSTQTITNGIDLAGEGGMIWCKSRNNSGDNALFDTERGVTKAVVSNTVGTEQSQPSSITDFLSDGFTTDNNGLTNVSGTTYTSWTFRKAPGFFDVVTYTGTGVARTIPHNLGSVPGCIIVKRTDLTGFWAVYHRSTGPTYYLVFNAIDVANPNITLWNNTAPTSTVFSVGTNAAVNASGGTYVAYLFAHDEQIFGEGGDQSVIKCGSYTGNGSTSGPAVDLGWEPQWLLVKSSTYTVNWTVIDVMRGLPVDSGASRLVPNTSDTEAVTSTIIVEPQATGFQIKTGAGIFNQTGQDYIYIAIRRGPMKTPTSGTEVFDASKVATGTTGLPVTTGFPIDLQFITRTSNIGSRNVVDRLRGVDSATGSSKPVLQADGVGSEFSDNYSRGWNNVGFTIPSAVSAFGYENVYWSFRRAPGFFDVVAYTGTGVARTVAHNLGAAPELIITKVRNTAGSSWIVDCVPLNLEGYLNASSSFVSGIAWNNGVTDSLIGTTFNGAAINASGSTYITYLFATLPGVSKCFNYTGTGTTLQIDCGFAAGARFVLLKRTDSAGNWLVADTARGIISGNDPLLYLNSTAAEITTLDWIDPHSSGFIVNQEATANANVGGATYIGLAIA